MNRVNFSVRYLPALLGCGVLLCLPASARAQDGYTPSLCAPVDLLDAPEEKRLDEPLLSIHPGKKPGAKRNIGSLLRNFGREWPRLLTAYVQPAVRGLVADQQGGNSLALKTTLFQNRSRTLQLHGGVGRNYGREREARLQLSMRF